MIPIKHLDDLVGHGLLIIICADIGQVIANKRLVFFYVKHYFH